MSAHHISGMQLGGCGHRYIYGCGSKVKSVLRFTEEDRMELNQTKCKEMIIDFRKNVTVIPPLEMNSEVFERVECYKLIGL
jgi:oligoribonuclease NrnB/cAMP/cGMP phosphodiesterase (DHH superfamily)